MRALAGQQPLFDNLPETERPEVKLAEVLPAQIRQLLDAGCQPSAALALMEKCGGLQVRFAENPRPGQLIVDRCGLDVAVELYRVAPGMKLNVPKGRTAQLALRNRAIRADYDAGLGIVELVDKYNLVTNAIRGILAG